MLSGLPGSHVCYGLPGCSPPCTDLTSLPANGGLYFQAFDGLVTLPLAGYDYSIDWTPMLAGLSPAGLTASLAAPILATILTTSRMFRRGEADRPPPPNVWLICVLAANVDLDYSVGFDGEKK